MVSLDTMTQDLSLYPLSQITAQFLYVVVNNTHVSFLQFHCNHFTSCWYEVLCSSHNSRWKPQCNQCNVLISQSVTQYVIFSVVINRFIQTSIKVINLQAVCFTQGLPLSQFHVLFLRNNCRLTFHFAGKKDTKLKVRKMIACSYNYIIKSQLSWMYKCVRDSNKQNLLQ